MDLAELKRVTPGLNERTHAEKIKSFAWFLHTQKHKAHFQPADLRKCYDLLHLTSPQSFGGYLANLMASKDILKNASGYRLSAAARDTLETMYAPAGHKVQVTALLKGLPALIPDLAERVYLDEALICYEHGAFRAAVVMTWNLAYHHLCDYVIKNRLAEFNARWGIKFPNQHKSGVKSIAVIDDFLQELKEAEMIAICKDAGIITKDIWKIMDEKLGRRNSAAHASSVVISQLQADAFIDDLVRNVVLKIN